MNIDHLIVELLMIIWLLLTVIEAARNYWLIEIGKMRPNYLQSFIIRGIIAILHSVGFNPVNFLDWLPILVWQCTGFFILFAPLLNILRGHKLFYIGEESGILDRYTYKYPWAYRILYYISIAAFIYTTIVILKRPLEW